MRLRLWVDICSHSEVALFPEVLQADYLNKVNYQDLTALETTTIETEWLRELLMDLLVVEKPISDIQMNYDNQIVIVKVNSSKDNMKSSRHVKRRLKSIRKLRNSGVVALD